MVCRECERKSIRLAIIVEPASPQPPLLGSVLVDDPCDHCGVVADNVCRIHAQQKILCAAARERPWQSRNLLVHDNGKTRRQTERGNSSGWIPGDCKHGLRTGGSRPDEGRGFC